MFTLHTLLVCALAALIPLVVGFLWYNRRTFGNAWIEASKVREEDTKNANMVLIFGLTYFFSLMLSLALVSLTIHQSGLFSLVADQPGLDDPNSAVRQLIDPVLKEYGNSFRTFKHGALHGTLAALFISLPILGVNALFEGKNWKYILINVGYWVVSLALMGGIVCQFA